MFGKI